MATLSTSIELYDKVTATANRMTSAINDVCGAYESVESAMSHGFDIDPVNQTTAAMERTCAEAEAVERNVRDIYEEQERFNRSAHEGTTAMDGLAGKVIGLVSAYASLQAVGRAINISDEMTQTTARVGMMNKAFNEVNGTAMKTDDLINLIYQSAQNARGSFNDMASVVAKFGNNARDAFSSQEEVVAFANLIQKQMTIAGASTTEASNAMMQLSQALGSGVLRGDELNSIFEQAPNLIQSIADYLDVPIGQIRLMASEGELSADIVKNAIFSATDEINAQFESIPMTWGQVWTSMKNSALMKFQPVLDKINELANNEKFQAFADDAVNALSNVAMILFDIMEFAGRVASFFSDNWSIIEPIIWGIVGALGAYYGAMLLYNTITGISTAITSAKAFAETVHTASLAMQTGATFTATAAQYGFNAALLACPITWIIVAILALVVAFYVLIGWINKTKGTSLSATGYIFGYFASMVAGIINQFIMMYNQIATVAEFLLNVFNNPTYAVRKLFGDLAFTVLDFCIAATSGFDEVATNLANAFIKGANYAIEGINWIIDALNRIPGVDIGNVGKLGTVASITSELSGIRDSINDWVGEAPDDYIEIAKKDYINIGDWASAGYAFGANAEESVKGFFSNFGVSDLADDLYGDGYGYDAGQVPANIADTAGNTASMADSMEITSEDLKYLRDIAERDVVNRFTTAEIKIEMTNNNSISSDMDLDGVVDYLATRVNDAMAMAAEGVHA